MPKSFLNACKVPGMAACAATRELIGESRAMLAVLARVAKVAASEATVLIQGETGTGKELVARAIHRRSHRSAGPFVAVDCGALAETVLESELFGHEPGSFTGAVRGHKGCFERAHSGTLFLDEVASMSPLLQQKLLRFLEEKEVTRVGGECSKEVDIRIVAATNADLGALAGQGRFRRDLLYRLDVVSIEVPPLRDRGRDVVLLAEHFLRDFAAKNERHVSGFTRQAMAALRQYSWPGNVRELRNSVEQAVVLSDGEEIGVGDLPGKDTRSAGEAPCAPVAALPGRDPGQVLEKMLEDLRASGKPQEIRRADVEWLLDLSPKEVRRVLRENGLKPVGGGRAAVWRRVSEKEE